jgi:formate hydrogenlyase subunit 3/multisubunit Na+/H+ antiporter MnhD subunit
MSLNFEYLPYNPTFDLNASSFSDVIILLAFSSGIVCIHLLGEKNLVNNLPNVTIFSGFLVSIIIMVYTCNILVMFIGFEFLFLPTLYFVYHHGYVERVDKTLKILLY